MKTQVSVDYRELTIYNLLVSKIDYGFDKNSVFKSRNDIPENLLADLEKRVEAYHPYSLVEPFFEMFRFFRRIVDYTSIVFPEEFETAAPDFLVRDFIISHCDFEKVGDVSKQVVFDDFKDSIRMKREDYLDHYHHVAFEIEDKLSEINVSEDPLWKDSEGNLDFIYSLIDEFADYHEKIDTGHYAA